MFLKFSVEVSAVKSEFYKSVKIFMGMGNVIVKKQVISSALALTVIAGGFGAFGATTTKAEEQKFNIIKNLKHLHT